MALTAIPRFERFFRLAAVLDFDRNDLKRFTDFCHDKLHDLLVAAQASAAANGRDVIEPTDLPITRGLQENIHRFKQIDEQLELGPILDQLATYPPMDRIPSEQTEARFPEIVGGLGVALARTFKTIYPQVKNPQGPHWDTVRAVIDLYL